MQLLYLKDDKTEKDYHILEVARRKHFHHKSKDNKA